KWMAAAASAAFVWSYPQIDTKPLKLASAYRVRHVFFSSDSTHLFAIVEVPHPVGTTNAVDLWDLRTRSFADNICELVNRNLTPDEWLQYIGTRIPRERTCPNISN